MKFGWLSFLAGIIIAMAFSFMAVPSPDGLTVAEQWLNQEPDYPLVREQYLHQVRVAESEFRRMVMGEQLSQERLDAVHSQIEMLSNVMRTTPSARSALPDVALVNYRLESRGIERSMGTLIDAHEDMLKWNRLVKLMRTDCQDLLVASDKLAVEVTRMGTDTEQVYVITRQMMLLQRIIANLQWLSHSPGADLEITSIDRIGRDAALFSRVVNALQKGDSRLGIHEVKDKSLGAGVDELMEATRKKLTDNIVPLLELAPAIFKYKETVRDLSRSIEKLEATANSMP